MNRLLLFICLMLLSKSFPQQQQFIVKTSRLPEKCKVSIDELVPGEQSIGDPGTDTVQSRMQFQRRFCVQTKFGFPGLFSLSSKADLGGHHSIGVKADLFLYKGQGQGINIWFIDGIGLVYSYNFGKQLLERSLFSVDYISAEISVGGLFDAGFEGRPAFIQVGLGNEKKHLRGFRFLWEIGIGTTFRDFNTPLILPKINIGLSYNI